MSLEWYLHKLSLYFLLSNLSRLVSRQNKIDPCALCPASCLRCVNVTDYPKFYKSVHSMPLRLQIPSGFSVRSVGSSRIFHIQLSCLGLQSVIKEFPYTIHVYQLCGTTVMLNSIYGFHVQFF